MKLQRAALAIAMLAFGAAVPRVATAQGINPLPGQRGAGSGLGQNYPNPFAQETRIPFTIGDFPTCSDAGQQHRVSLRIYNLLSQVVSVPVLQSGAGVAGGEPVENLFLTCGQFVAYWDGNFLNTSQAAPSGVYLYRLELDGRPSVKKMFKSR